MSFGARLVWDSSPLPSCATLDKVYNLPKPSALLYKLKVQRTYTLVNVSAQQCLADATVCTRPDPRDCICDLQSSYCSFTQHIIMTSGSQTKVTQNWTPAQEMAFQEECARAVQNWFGQHNTVFSIFENLDAGSDWLPTGRNEMALRRIYTSTRERPRTLWHDVSFFQIEKQNWR